ncbi:L-histidine N(alpha)-methyltransferase [Luteimonas terricola]|uniref:Dimethylhistidine N-methyltransferase n=1 Tax=Luteimonas terricola TaxID=645597 RepID=A0ABQ2EID9_9GAMM|nr:L-histidine N(alpha)-methyltransferase [Luteimonas terricola]GGK09957.1 dimethylhistidine N-methyltransferase [Luteimonas terricola]
MNPELRLTDLHPSADDITGDVLRGLASTPKRLPSKYFYDRRGSELFEAITHQPEYYPTRIELALLSEHGPEIAAAAGPCMHVVEYGSGSGRKTRLLLDALEDPVAYTPIEISRSALTASAERLDREFGDVEVLPVLADFTRAIALPSPSRPAASALVFFPGSTLGNFGHEESVRLLQAMRDTMGGNGAALVGIDLEKDPAIVEAAYNDAAGITAEFTLNLLHRLNRDVGSDFDPGAFAHRACYVVPEGRIVTTLESLRDQVVTVEGRAFGFAAGEHMHVEQSQKYSDARIAALAARAGLRVAARWNDPLDWFGLRLLRPATP